MDPEKMETRVGDKTVELTKAEFGILLALLSKPGRVFSREELLNAAFGEAYEGYERTIDTHIRNLRRKIEIDPAKPEYILTVFGWLQGRGTPMKTIRGRLMIQFLALVLGGVVLVWAGTLWSANNTFSAYVQEQHLGRAASLLPYLNSTISKTAVGRC